MRPLALLAALAAAVCVATPALAGLPSADLSIVKTDGALDSVPGETVTYTITATNNGPDPVTAAAFGDLFVTPLSGCSWSCVGQLGGACTTGAGSGNNANQNVDLPVGGQVVVTATCTIASSATLSFFNTATITQPAGVDDPNGVNNSSTDVNGLTPVADVSILKTDGVPSEVPGTPVTYTITATNAGPSDAPTVTITDTFPAFLQNCSTTCVPTGGATCDAGPSLGLLNDVISLPAGGTATYTATCDIPADVTGGITNTAFAVVGGGVTDPNPLNNDSTDVDFFAAAIPALGDLGLVALVAGLGFAASRKLRRLGRR
jgi:uncharacterized repeat protein (TIGR01451 family)